MPTNLLHPVEWDRTPHTHEEAAIVDHAISRSLSILRGEKAAIEQYVSEDDLARHRSVVTAIVLAAFDALSNETVAVAARDDVTLVWLKQHGSQWGEVGNVIDTLNAIGLLHIESWNETAVRFRLRDKKAPVPKPARVKSPSKTPAPAPDGDRAEKIRPLQWDRSPATDRARELVSRIKDREWQALENAQSWLGRTEARDEVSDAMTAILCDVAYQALLAPEVWVSVDQSRDVVPYVVQNLVGCFEASYENAGPNDPLVWLHAGVDLLAPIKEFGLTKDDFSPSDDPTYEVLRFETKDGEGPSRADTPTAAAGQFRVAGDRVTSGTIEEIEAGYDDRGNAVYLNMRFMLSDMFGKSVDELVEDIYGKTGEKKTDQSVEQTRLALRLILGNLLRAYQIDPKRYVGLSLRDEQYKDGLNNPVGIHSRAIKRVKDYLTAGKRPLVHYRKGYLNRATGQSQSSRIRATDRLEEVVKQGLNPEGLARLTVDTWTDPNLPSLADLYDVFDGPVIVLRAEKQEGEKTGKVIERWEWTPRGRQCVIALTGTMHSLRPSGSISFFPTTSTGKPSSTSTSTFCSTASSIASSTTGRSSRVDGSMEAGG